MSRIAAVLFLCAPICAFCQSVRNPVSASYIRVGAYSNTHVDVFSFHANQAALAKMKNVSAGIYGEKRFLLNEMGLYNVAMTLPTSSGNFGFDARYYGFSDYNESQVGLAYARNLGRKLDIGVQFNYYNVRIAGYGNASAINFEIGTILHLTDNLNAGMHVYNPVGGSLGKSGEEKLASVYSAGIGYEGSEKFFLSIEIEKEEDEPVNVNAGLQYTFLPQLSTRIGISTAMSSIFFGIGFGLKMIRVDVTTSYHPQLGITPGLSLIFNIHSLKGSD
ncbi:MAG TPA: hypothetical protein VGQ53_11870 [Chitinophagaceae bacterium]|nr:hypothetical protein [Chitinophagaceae bacterium]